VWKGSFLTRTFGGAAYRTHMNEPWLGEAAYLVNEDDGSYYTEAQLRRHMREESEFCFGDMGCRGKCLALPGDTIYWHVLDGFRRVVIGWEPATDEELRERGWDAQGGWLARHCELFREEAQTRGFRFDVGTQVLCRVGENEWQSGTIIQLLYREDDWPKDQFAPYKIKLDEDGRHIFAPEDSDDMIKLKNLVPESPPLGSKQKKQKLL